MGRGFATALTGACALLLISAVTVALSLRGSTAPFRSAATERLEIVRTIGGDTPAGAYDPVLAATAGGFETVLADRSGGQCLLSAVATAPATVRVGAGGDVAMGVRAAYCSAAPLPSGAIAVVSSTPAGGTTAAAASSGIVAGGQTVPGAAFGPVWLTTSPSGVYLTAETTVGGRCCGVAVWHSSDGLVYTLRGAVPEAAGEAPDPATFFGAAAVSATGGSAPHRLYVPFTHALQGSPAERELELAASSDGGVSWSIHPVFTDAAGATVAAQYPVAAVDAGGTVYVAWSDIGHVFYAWSRSDGVTMSRAQIVDSGEPLNVMPAIVAGDPGHVAIAWYASGGTTAMGPDAAARDAWRPVLAVTSNAAGAAPDIRRLTLDGNPVHRGSVCLLGIACTNTGDHGPYDDRLGSELGLALDPVSGGLFVAHGEDTASGGPRVRLVEEVCGDRLLIRPPRPLPSCG